MSNYDGKIELPQTYHNQGNERYLSSDKPDIYLWLAEENTKQAKQIERLQEQLKEANELLELYFPKDKKINSVCVKPINDYRKKWGVK